MITYDISGKVIVDNTGDGGDSANRNGLWVATSKSPLYEMNLSWYFVNGNGICFRHPVQVPWSNSKNFSRDQLIPLIAGLNAQKKHDVCRKIFWTHAKRFFFAQNSERDYVGTTKYPWPHSFINDRGQFEKRSFDFADPLLPNDILLLILCGRIRYLYPFYPIGIFFFCVSLVLHCKFNDDTDEGQLLSACFVHGNWATKFYVKMRPDYAKRIYKYWVKDRDQVEFYDRIMSKISRSLQ